MEQQPDLTEPGNGRLSAKPIHNIYGHRPMKRAKRPYKSKGKPLALTQAENIRADIAKGQQSRAAKSRTIHSPQKYDRLKNSRVLERARVLRVLLAGASAYQVSQELKLDVNYCTTLLKDIQNDIQRLGIEEFKSLLWRKVSGIIDDHTVINGSLELLLYQVDTDLRRIGARLDSLSARITEHQADQPPLGEAYNAQRAQWQATGRALEAEQAAIQALRQGLRTEKTALQREKRANNKDFVDTLSKMGVTSSPPASNNKVPSDSATPSEIPVSYVGMSEESALLALERALEDDKRYLREQKKLKQVVETESSPNETEIIENETEKT